jgi:hypothetical protein
VLLDRVSVKFSRRPSKLVGVPKSWIDGFNLSQSCGDDINSDQDAADKKREIKRESLT